MRRRVIIAIAVVVAAVVGVLLWRDRGDDGVAEDAASTTGSARGSGATIAGKRWFEQSKLGGRRIAGLVLGGDGAPVRGATVRIASTFTMAGLDAEPSRVTDAAGRFDFGAQPAAAYVVIAEQPRLTGALVTVDLRDSTVRPPPDDLRLVLHACDASIHGTVRDTAGGVIRGAVIARADAGLTTRGGVETDADGKYELCVPPGNADVMVQADGYAASPDHVSVYGRTRRDFALIPATTVVGRVVRAGDRAPVAGAIVELQAEDPSIRRAPLITSSDADGRFHHDGVPPGRYSVHARADRLASARGVDVTAEIGKPPEEVVCELAATFAVSGKVIERETRAPAAGVTVHLMSRTTRDLRRPAQVVSEADGSFVFEHVLPGHHQPLVARTSDDKPPAVVVESADITGLVLEIDQRSTISGRILQAGLPVDGASVRARTTEGQAGASTVSRHDGSFTLRGLEAGTFSIYAQSDRLGAFTNGPSIAITRGEQRTGVDVELDMSGSIAGIVVDQHDAPVAGAFLRFSLLRGRDFGEATTADDGTFTTRGLSGGGDYVYEVRQRDRSTVSYPPASGKRFAPVAVPDGKSHVTGIRIKIRIERFAIAGRIADADGKPVADATIRAVSRAAGWYSAPTATSDETGAFRFADLPAGSYTLEATTTRGDVREDDVDAGRTNVMLRLLALGALEGTLDGFPEPPDVVAYRSNARGGQYRAIVTGTTFQVRNLPPGEYWLVASSATELASERARVEPGETAKIALRVVQVGVITGTVVDEQSRAPIAGLHCQSARRGGDRMTSAGGSITDASGAFRLERVPVGPNLVGCYGKATSGRSEAVVSAGQTTRVELVVKPAPTDPITRGGHAGMTLEDQLREVMVKSVEPGGPAARAGIAVGDVLLKIDDDTVGAYESGAAIHSIEHGPLDKPRKLLLERNDKELTVMLTVEPAR